MNENFNGTLARQYRFEHLLKRTEAEKKFHDILNELNIHFEPEQVFHHKITQFYIADFYIPRPINIVFEIDGKYHLNTKVIDKDVRKKLFLECDRGFTVYRFSNEEVLNETEKVKQEVLEILENHFNQTKLIKFGTFSQFLKTERKSITHEEIALKVAEYFNRKNGLIDKHGNPKQSKLK